MYAVPLSAISPAAAAYDVVATSLQQTTENSNKTPLRPAYPYPFSMLRANGPHGVYPVVHPVSQADPKIRPQRISLRITNAAKQSPAATKLGLSLRQGLH